MRLIIDIGFAALAIYIAYSVVTQYYAASNLKGWERWRATAMNSATMLWGKLCLFAAGILDNAETIFNALGMDSVSEAIKQWVDPKTAAAVIAFVTVGAMLTRLRSLAK